MVGAHLQESRPSQGGEGHAGASMPCAPHSTGRFQAKSRRRRARRCLDALLPHSRRRGPKAWVVCCPEDILKSGGSLGGGVKSVLRNLAFVQPRFESEATPRRRYVCLLRAIARVLMVKACDPRSEAAVRRRASEALTAMEKRSDAVMAGLAGDYSEACVECLRVFDVDDQDIARTLPELTGFLFF